MDRNKVRIIGIYKYKVLKNTTSKYFCSKSGEGTGAEMCPAIVSGIVTKDALVIYWPIFSVTIVTVPEVFANVYVV